MFNTIVDIEHRIAELKRDAETEGQYVSKDSESDLRRFLNIRPAITLLDNGNFRAVWKMADLQVGLQFCGEKHVQYVILPLNKCGRTAF